MTTIDGSYFVRSIYDGSVVLDEESGMGNRNRATRWVESLLFLASYLISLVSVKCFQFRPPLFRRHPDILKSTAHFDSLTVKELQQLVKKCAKERVALSRLKKKQDLIAFLENQKDQSCQASDTRNIPTSKSVSLKDALHRKVYHMYPPLLKEDERECTSDRPEDDIRQLYHPILKTNKNSSDMDLVFLGTASCTPSITRGVSCLALRLNWRRRTVLEYNGALDERHSTFHGGTWLFDAGECTQVGS